VKRKTDDLRRPDVVEWDDETPEAYADAFLEALEASYQVEVVELEWRAPLGDGRYLMPAYIERGNSQGAYTTVAECGRSYVPYMVAYSGSWADASWADTMAAHEFNHALQFGYGWALEFWFWEATATYVEDSVFESDWWTWYVSGYSMNPHIAMGASSQDDQDVFWHMYGMAIWVRYLHEYQGGLDTVKQIWELGSEQRTNGYDYTQEEALTEAGVDFQAAYLDFIARTSVMDYEDHRALSAYASVAMSDTIDSLPAEGESESRTEPEGYGQNFYTFDAGMGDGTLRVTFEGEDAVEWGIVLAENDGRAVTRSVSVVTEGGVGTLDLTGYGDEEVVLVVSPLTDADRGRSYTWSAELVAEADAGEGDDTDTDDDGLSDGGEEVKLGGSCGCASSTAAGSAWVAAGALALVLARRRR
jgi:MYXO-CTERM domain-containing protein